MIYLTSDIHGNYERYKKLLELIKLKQEDTLYVLGDCVDRYPQSMEVLLDMAARPNVVPIMGNHDVLALYCLKKLQNVNGEEDLDTLEMNVWDALLQWFRDGGEVTLDNFLALGEKDKEKILEYLSNFSLYKEINVNGKKYLLVHAGLNNFAPEKPLEDYDLNDLIFCRPDYSQAIFKDNEYLVVGHTPTQNILGNPRPGFIYQENNYIVIDCGCGFKIGRLAALCLDTGEEFYVE